MAGKHYLHGRADHFFSLYCFLFVSLENRVARNLLRVLFLVIFPAIRKKENIYIAANGLPAKIYPE